MRQVVREFSQGPAAGSALVATTALRDITGAGTEDSYFHTTFNSPVIRLAEGLRFLALTWGLTGGEGTGMGGNLPDAAMAPGIDALTEQLRLADFSRDVHVHQTGNKPFAPLAVYDGQERTLVVFPLDQFLVSPVRLIGTPKGMAVARGLHGAVDQIPAGTVTQTALVFGQGLVDLARYFEVPCTKQTARAGATRRV